MIDLPLSDRIALAVCKVKALGFAPCGPLCSDCRRDSAAVAHEIAAWLRERHGGAITTADALYAVGTHQPEPQAGWQPIDPGKEAMAIAITRELRRPDV